MCNLIDFKQLQETDQVRYTKELIAGTFKTAGKIYTNHIGLFYWLYITAIARSVAAALPEERKAMKKIIDVLADPHVKDNAQFLELGNSLLDK